MCATPSATCGWPTTAVVDPVLFWWGLPLGLALAIGALAPLAGTLLLVQRRLFLANLISHAVLPGLAVAVALRLDPALGGVLSGVAGALLAERLSRGGAPGEEADAAVLNTVLAGFLGLGVLLIPLLHIRVDLEAVLFGDLLAAAPVDLLRTLLALAAVLLLLALRYQQLVFLGVDPLGAASAGLPVQRLRLLLTLVTAVTVVSAMTAVGVVQVIALMGAPALLALGGATSLRQALLRAALIGMAITALGFSLALLPAVNLPPGPLIGVLCLALLPLRAWPLGRGR
jgi:zinc/manganese transport system permease protein